MKITKRLLLICGLALVATFFSIFVIRTGRYYATLRRDTQPVDQQYLAAFRTATNANNSRVANKPWSALHDSFDAYIRLHAIRQSHPEWHPAMVDTRLGRTRSDLADSALALIGISSQPTTPKPARQTSATQTSPAAASAPVTRPVFRLGHTDRSIAPYTNKPIVQVSGRLEAF